MYTLRRVAKAEDEVFYPEKAEDLAVYSLDGQLIEVIQVKDHAKALTFSDLEGFLQRSTEIVKAHPDVRIVLASFGPIGSELNKALENNAESINLKFHHVLPALQCLEIQILDESEELSCIGDFLASLPMLIGDPQAAFDILMQSLYRGAELAEKFTHQSLLEHAQNIGSYLAGREAHHREWGTSILPLEPIETKQNERLHKEFFQGVAARWEHINSGSDVVRPEHLGSIATGFKDTNVVIVHGASGQGKSTLAYRYLHDCCPSTTCYEIRDLSTPIRALEIAAALRGYGSGLPVPLTFYVDVSHADTGLPEFLKQTAKLANIRVLVTIREEDWRLVSLSNADLQFTDFELSFNRREAQLLFDRFENHFPDFGQAWAHFTEEGPLLEFVYLLTHTENLRACLDEQYSHIADDAKRTLDLKLLEYVAVAGKCGARIDLFKLKETCPRISLKRAIERLEGEYLIRRSDDKSCLSGMHPIRSTILCELFIDSVINPWADLALRCLPLLPDADLDVFLLYNFVTQPEADEALITYLESTRLPNWASAGCIVRALLWKGVYEYTKAHHVLIQEVEEEVGDGWLMMLDFDLLGMLDGESTQNDILRILPAEGKMRAHQWRSQQLPKTEAFSVLNHWLSQSLFPLAPCEHDLDWKGLGEIAYWIGFGNLETDLYKSLDWDTIDRAIETLPLQTLATVVFGLWHAFSDCSDFTEWYSRIRPQLLRRYQNETLTPYIEVNDKVIRAHFIAPLEEGNHAKGKADEGNYLHSLAIAHVELLAQLQPDFEGFGCQGYGHKVFDYMDYDDTTKTAISSAYLLPDWVTQVNKTWRILGGHIFRPSTWQDYCNQMLDTRKSMVQCMDELHHSLSKHFRSKKVVKQLTSLSETSLWKKSSRQTARTPTFPTEALDPWGFIEEGSHATGKNKQTSQGNKQKVTYAASLKRYNRYLNKKCEFFNGVSNFLNQAPDFMVAYGVLGKAKTIEEQYNVRQKIQESGINLDKPFLSSHNLAEALKSLSAFQKLYQQYFSSLSDLRELNNLEKKEAKVLKDIWCLWYFFINKPAQKWDLPGKTTSRQLGKEIHILRERIEHAVKLVSTVDYEFQCLPNIHVFEGAPALWITLNGECPIDVYSKIELFFEQLSKSLGEIKLHSLGYYALQFQWENLVIVPLCRGKMIDRHGWVIPVFQLISDLNVSRKLSKLSLVPRPLDADVLADAGIDEWKLPQLSDAKSLVQSFATMQIQLSHLVQIGEIPELDASENSVVQEYFSGLQENISENLKQTLDSAKILAQQYRHASPKYRKETAFEKLEGAFQSLDEIYGVIMPAGLENGQDSLDMDLMAERQKKLVSIQGDIFIIYLLWAGYLIEIACL